MGKSFTLIQTVTTAGVFSAVSFWYGFMFGRESARKELGDLIEGLKVFAVETRIQLKRISSKRAWRLNRTLGF